MTPDEVLNELLGRLAAARGAAVFLKRKEMDAWPKAVVQALKESHILIQAEPAASMECPKCEYACTLPVYIRSGISCLEAFVVCEERSDTNRVTIPIADLEQWQISFEGLARSLAHFVDIPYKGLRNPEANLIEIGLLRGGKHSRPLLLQVKERTSLLLAGHVVPLIEVLRLDGGVFKVDYKTLYGLVDTPVGPAGGAESTQSRRIRLQQWIDEEITKGNKAFLKTVAAKENVSPQRIKQLLTKKPASRKRRR